jgi:hypothetical protein
MQIDGSGADGERPEKTVYGSFLYHILTAAVTTAKFTILGFDIENDRSLFIFCLKVLLVGQPECMMQQTCTHWSSDLLSKYITGTHLYEEP